MTQPLAANLQRELLCSLHRIAQRMRFEGATLDEWEDWIDAHPASKRITLRQRNAIGALVWNWDRF